MYDRRTRNTARRHCNERYCTCQHAIRAPKRFEQIVLHKGWSRLPNEKFGSVSRA
jgi:hypothetical protein